ncbi:MAG: DUF1919 domain-containing protein [Alistipes sp.]|nr:DUF1919 domain-containing protein [Alistipes sp.]
MIHPLANFRHYLWRRSLRNTQVSIVSDNCWGGFMSQYCRLPYRSPFVGLFVPAPDYLRMLRALRAYVEGDFRFVTRHDSVYRDRLTHVRGEYPVGILTPVGGGEPVEVHFLHYASPEEALAKWRKRAARLDYDNLLVKLADRDLCTPELIAEFDALDYPSKVCFTSRPSPYASTVWIATQCYRRRLYNEWKYCAPFYNFAKAANALLDRGRSHRCAAEAAENEVSEKK